MVGLTPTLSAICTILCAKLRFRAICLPDTLFGLGGESLLPLPPFPRGERRFVPHVTSPKSGNRLRLKENTKPERVPIDNSAMHQSWRALA